MSEILIAEASGVALYQQARRLLIVDRGTASLYTLGFVLAIVAFILGINGVVQLVLATGGGGIAWLGVVFTAVAAVGGWGLSRILARVARQRERPVAELRLVAIFDLEGGQLCDPSGRPLAPLASVRVGRQFQLASSSPALTATWPGGKVILARGNPFAGGIGPLEDAFRTVGLAT